MQVISNTILKNFYLTVSVILIVLFVSFQYYANVYTHQQFHWLGAIDTDTIYQTERLLIVSGWNGIEMLNSAPIDYGSEMYLLKPLLTVISVFSSDPVWGYRIIALVHLLSVVCSFLLVSFIFANYKNKFLYLFCLVILVVASPLFATYAAFIKPDSNVILLSSITSVYFVKKFAENNKQLHLFYAIVFSAFAVSIKWWGVFLIPGIGYVFLLRYNSAYQSVKRVKLIFLTLMYFLALTILAFFLIGRFEMQIVEFIVNKNISFLISLFGLLKFSAGTFLLLCSLIIIFLSWVLYVSMLRIVQKSSNKFWISLFYGGELSAVWLIAVFVLWLPYILDKNLVSNSNDYYGKYMLDIGEIGFLKLFSNIKSWVSEMYLRGMISVSVIGLIVFELYFAFKNRVSWDPINKVLVLYLGIFVLFLFLFITKLNEATMALLYFIMCLWVVSLFNMIMNIATGEKRKRILVIVSVFIGMHILEVSVVSPVGPVSNYYSNRLLILNQLRGVENKISSVVVGIKNKNVYVCNRNVPVNKVVRLNMDICLSEFDRNQKMSGGDILILEKKQMLKLISKKRMHSLSRIASIESEISGRNGMLNIKTYEVLLKNE